ncbi:MULTISPECIES: GNAT family N-acetyltransferase [Microbacterium]|uniref:N-acyltransferase YncA n=1 Tax=Microbacterium trichothecenolyticum TaxID=69370 RepID=A0A0M2H9V8_MICTR|nr:MULTISPECIES: GNAT family N-acetyltransferase [Microbacterium]KJL41424.1 N-acyltransferase YncA [Microbacterium trichothecenolyticum]MDR7190499.1 phosphinothricin acetyltransferase [Microbacterium sp. BE35]
MTRLREMVAADWPAVEAIYAQGIEDGEATFEVATPAWNAFDAGKLPALRFVIPDESGALLGWIAASPVSSRPAYRGVVEHSVYVDRNARGQGIGRRLLDAFVAGAEESGIWTIQSSIFPENAASLRLHETAGFRVVGRRERIARSEIGPHAGAWRDTLLIERRSTSVHASEHG